MIVAVRNLYKKYKKAYVLKNVSFEIKKGQIFGFIGPDGAGKSTLMKIISGVLSFDRGHVSVCGMDVRKQPDEIKKILAFMPQGIGQNLYMDLTVSENIDFFAELKRTRPEIKNKLKDRLLEATGLKPFANTPAKNLSGGMQQKLGICCSLITEPKVIILDEPTTGVDPVSRREIWNLLYEFLEEDVTIIISTSYMDEAERCHEIALMNDGNIIAQIPTKELIDEYGSAENLFKRLINQKPKQIDIPFKRLSKPKGIFAKNLTKFFGSFKAVDGVTIDIKPSEVFGLLGPNGAGKTTTIKMLVGIIKPSSGFIETIEKQELGYMSQKFSLYKDLTVSENIDFYAALYNVSKSEIEKRKEWILELSGLKDFKKELVKNIPLGMKQRLALGCSLIHIPSVLLLDEPTSGVDPIAREEFWTLIMKLSRELNITILVTTHHLVEANYCDRLALMNRGKIVAEGAPLELKRLAQKQQGNVFEVFAEDLRMIKNILDKANLYNYFFGKRIRVWDRITEEQLKSILNGTNARIIPSQVSMEDVFVHFSQKGEKVAVA